MSFLEIIVIILAAGFVLFMIGSYIYKRIKGIPTGECASCKFKNSQGLKDYYNQHKCDCK